MAAPTRAERIATLNRKQRIAKLMENRASKRGSMDAPSTEPTMSTWEQFKGGAREVAQGLSFETIDEATSASNAAIGWATDAITGRENNPDFSDRYTANMNESDRLIDEYRAEDPITSGALNISGALLGGGYSGAKMLGMEVVKRAPALAKAIAAMTSGATEGTVQGFASGRDMEERIDRGKTGFKWGAGLPLALSTAGKGIRAVSNKVKLDKPLEVLDGVQMPLNKAAPETMRGNLMRDTVGTAFGGRDVYKKTLPFINRAEDAVGRKVDRGTRVNEAVRTVGNEADRTGRAVIQQTKDAGKAAVDNATQVVKSNTAAQTEALDAAFMKKVIDESLPANLSDDARLIVNDPTATTQAKVDAIWSGWNTNGFDSIKNTTFDIDPTVFKKNMKGLFDDSPAMNTQAGEYMTSLNKSFDQLYDASSGQMSGANLMELRNRYARAASDATDNTQRSIFRTVSNKIDDLMTENVPAEQKTAFLSEKEAYDSFIILRTATGKASSKKAGDFTVDEWLSSGSTYRQARGKGPQQTLAQNIQKQKKVLNEAQGQQIKNLPEKQQAKIANADATAGLKQAKEASRLRGLTAKANARRGLDKAKENLAQVKLASPSEKPPLATRLISTGMLGSWGVGGGPKAVIAGGMSTAATLATDRAQRVLAGQSLDEVLNSASRAKVGGLRLADILRQGTTSGNVAAQTD